MSIVNRIVQQVTGRAGRAGGGRAAGPGRTTAGASGTRRQDEAIGRGVRKLLRRAR